MRSLILAVFSLAALLSPYQRNGLPNDDQVTNARIAAASERTTQPRRRNVYDYDGEYEFHTVRHWTAPKAESVRREE